MIPTVPFLACIPPLKDEICPEAVVMDPPSILPVADIDPLVVIISANAMLHCAAQVSTDVLSPSENPFLLLIMPPV